MIEDKKFVIGVILATLIIFVGGIWFYSKPTEVNTNQQIYAYDEIVRDAGYNTIGLPTAPVVLVEFSDPQCPACRSMEATIKALLDKYPEQVRLVYRHFPLPIHNQAVNASRALEAAGKQGKFFEMLDGLFENQESLSDEKFVEIANSLQLNIDQFNQDRSSDEAKNIVDQDKQKALQLDIPGTPTLFINGKMVNFEQTKPPLQTLSEEVENILVQIPVEETVSTPSAENKVE